MTMTCPAFIAQSLAVRTATHLLHLSSKSYAQHMALGEFYESLVGRVDAYAEVYMGVEGRITAFPAVLPPKGTPLDVLEDYLETVQAEAEEDHDSEALKSILAEIEELTAQALYKLRFLA